MQIISTLHCHTSSQHVKYAPSGLKQEYAFESLKCRRTAWQHFKDAIAPFINSYAHVKKISNKEGISSLYILL